MTIEHIIVHRLQKQRNEVSTLHLRKHELEVTPAAEYLLAELTAVYEKKTGKAYGIFQQDREVYPFSTLLERYLDGSDGGFADLTRKVMNLFKTKIDQAKWATGGYVVFILYGAEPASGGVHNRHLIVVMLNDRRGTAVDSETLEIRNVVHLVLDELHLAARVDITGWRTGAVTQYLSFIKGPRSGVSVSRYFRELLGCAEYVDAIRQSRDLVRAVDAYIEQHNLSRSRAREIQTTVYEYAADMRQQGDLVDLEVLSTRIEPDGFLEFANSEEVGLSSSFEPDLRTLRPFGRFYYSDDQLAIGFNLRLLGNVVQYNADSESLTITPLPGQLVRQLEEVV